MDDFREGRCRERGLMLKRIVLFTALMVFSAAVAHGAPVGNIADPAMLYRGVLSDERPYGLVLGFEYDWNTTRAFKNQQNKDYELNIAEIKLGAIIRKSIFLYGLFGQGQYSDKKDPNKYKTRDGIDYLQFKTDPGIVYGAGITAIMYEQKVEDGVFLRVGMNAQYRRSEFETDDADLFLTRFNPAIPTQREDRAIPNTNYELEFDEYHVALEVSYQIDDAVPYLGFRVSEGRGNEVINPPEYENYDNRILAERNKGYIVGFTYYFFDKCSLGIEGRLGDEDALTMSALVRF